MDLCVRMDYVSCLQDGAFHSLGVECGGNVPGWTVSAVSETNIHLIFLFFFSLPAAPTCAPSPAVCVIPLLSLNLKQTE